MRFVLSIILAALIFVCLCIVICALCTGRWAMFYAACAFMVMFSVMALLTIAVIHEPAMYEAPRQPQSPVIVNQYFLTPGQRALQMPQLVAPPAFSPWQEVSDEGECVIDSEAREIQQRPVALLAAPKLRRKGV
jgi:hypothetical protein